MIKKILLALSCSLLFALVGLQQSAHATDLKYFWNGNEKIIGVGGPFEEMKTRKEDKDNDATGVTFELSRNTIGGFEYKNSSLALGVSVSRSGPIPGALCVVTSMSIIVDRSPKPSRVIGVIIHSAHAANDGFDPVAWWENVTQACKSGLNGQAFALAASAGGANILNQDFRSTMQADILGTPGQNPIIYRFEDQLKKMKTRETTRYLHRICSVSKPETKCTDPVKKSYEIIWDTCRNKVYSSGELTESSEGLPDSENTGNKIVDEFKDCIKEYSGLDINSNLLAYQTSIDIVGSQDTRSCSIPYIGYIVCPLSRFMAAIVDQAFKAFQVFFEVTPLDRGTDAGNLLFATWSIMRNFANVIFVLVFMLVVLAQVSNFGISNYGIKKLLPKLIIMAVLMNMSYLLCTLAVDISNILGDSLRTVLLLMKPTVAIQPDTWGSQVEQIIVYSTLISGIGLVLLTGSLVALFPLLVGAAISLLVTIVIILARYAIILGLTIVAPLAFACTLLPGTKSWYDKWFNLFMSMLMLYPIVSVVFGGSTIASMIVMNSSLSHATGSISLQLFGLAIQFLPLAITPLLIKLGGSVLGQVGNKVQGSGVFGKARKNADAFVKRKQNARDIRGLRNFGANKRGGLGGLRDKAIQRRYKRDGIRSMRQGEFHQANQQYISGYLSGADGYGGGKQALGFGNKTRGEKFAEQMAAGGGNVAKVRSDAIRAQATITAENVDVHKFTLKSHPPEQLQSMIANPSTDEEIRQAAIEIVKERGMPADINNMVKASGSTNMTHDQRATIAAAAAASSPLYSSPQAQQAIMDGRVNEANFSSTIVAPALMRGDLSAKTLGGSHLSTVAAVSEAVEGGHVDAATANEIRNLAHEAASNPSNLESGHASRESIAELRRLSGRP